MRDLCRRQLVRALLVLLLLLLLPLQQLQAQQLALSLTGARVLPCGAGQQRAGQAASSQRPGQFRSQLSTLIPASANAPANCTNAQHDAPLTR